MAQERNPEFEKFSALTRKVLKMSHEQLKAKLEAEKKAKEIKRKHQSVGSSAKGSPHG